MVCLGLCALDKRTIKNSPAPRMVSGGAGLFFLKSYFSSLGSSASKIFTTSGSIAVSAGVAFCPATLTAKACSSVTSSLYSLGVIENHLLKIRGQFASTPHIKTWRGGVLPSGFRSVQHSKRENVASVSGMLHRMLRHKRRNCGLFWAMQHFS